MCRVEKFLWSLINGDDAVSDEEQQINEDACDHFRFSFNWLWARVEAYNKLFTCFIEMNEMN